jgi:AcrR family transcriptional regulator
MVATTRPTGLRERKKARTRQALTEAALRLCLQRGFDAVTVAEIADAADVSVTTLFSYFPNKEALLFDLEEQIDAGLTAAVRDRPAEQDPLGAIRAYLLTLPPWDPTMRTQYQQFSTLVQNTPALSSYWQQMWMRHADTLAKAIATDRGLDEPDLRSRAIAKFVVVAAMLAEREPDPPSALTHAFALLRIGLDTHTA